MTRGMVVFVLLVVPLMCSAACAAALGHSVIAAACASFAMGMGVGGWIVVQDSIRFLRKLQKEGKK